MFNDWKLPNFIARYINESLLRKNNPKISAQIEKLTKY